MDSDRQLSASQPIGGVDGVFHLLHPDRSIAIVAASTVTAGGAAEWARRTLLPEGATGRFDPKPQIRHLVKPYALKPKTSNLKPKT